MTAFIQEKAVPLAALGVVAALAFMGKVSGAEAMAFIAGAVLASPQFPKAKS